MTPEQWDKKLVIEHDQDLKLLLTELREELNLLNTLNCNVHRYQGNFSVEQDLALKRTEAAQALYLAHLQSKVTPLFVKLGRLIKDESVMDDADFASVARRWYQRNYSTGILW